MESYGVEKQLVEFGTDLFGMLPSSVDKLLSLLDKIEQILLSVNQALPSVQLALLPLRKGLIATEILRHPDANVRVSVASCITKISGVTTANGPYDDGQMKVVFQLIVEAFEYLPCAYSRCYSKAVSILDTVASCKSFLVMLDLKLDDLVAKTFTLFLKNIRPNHPDNVSSAMETIMTAIINAKEDLSFGLLNPLIDSVRKKNKDISPLSWKLGDKVVSNCATKLKPHLVEAVKSTGVGLDGFAGRIVCICRSDIHHKHKNGKTSRRSLDDETMSEAAENSHEQGLDGRKFKDQAAKVRYDLLVKRAIIKGEVLNLDQCCEQGLKTRELFVAVNLQNVVGFMKPYYSEVIRLFYANLKVVDGAIHTYFEGEDVVITEKDINDAFEAPDPSTNPGLRHQNFQYFDEQRVDYQKAILGLRDEDPWRVHKLTTTDLEIEQRVALFAVTHDFVPRKGTNNDITKKEEYVLGSLFMGRMINLGEIVVSRMAAAIVWTNMGLPYGKMIATLLERKGFNLSGYEVEVEGSNRIINLAGFKAGFKKRTINRVPTSVSSTPGELPGMDETGLEDMLGRSDSSDADGDEWHDERKNEDPNSNIAELREEVKDIKEDLRIIKVEVTEVKEELKRMSNSLSSALDYIRECFPERKRSRLSHSRV